jgi:hypothetical protein
MKKVYKQKIKKSPRKIRKDKGILKVRFCPRGHDKDIVGRNTQGHCIECGKIWAKEYYDKNKATILPKSKARHRKLRKKFRKIREAKKQQDLKDAIKKGVKFCFKCKTEKPLKDFSLDKTRYLGVSSYCKDCQKVLINDWKRKHKEHIKQHDSEWHQKNKDRVAIRRKRWLKDNPGWSRKYCKKQRHLNIQVRLAWLLRSRLGMALKQNIKNGSAVRDLGCSLDFFIQYLESKFLSGMTWKNHGFGNKKWHIDHIIPLSSFDLTDRKQLLKAVHYTNLQPLWQKDNLSKSAKIF